MSLPCTPLDIIVPFVPRAADDYFMSDFERCVVIALMKSIAPQTVVEIGVQRGCCARLLLEHVPSITSYVGVDVVPDYKTTLTQQQAEVPAIAGDLVHDPRFLLMIRPNGSLDLNMGDLPVCDAMLIDGDHSAAAVLRDSFLAFARVRPGGLILWHDYWPAFASYNGVVDVLDNFAATGHDIRHIADTWLAMEVQRADARNHDDGGLPADVHVLPAGAAQG